MLHSFETHKDKANENIHVVTNSSLKISYFFSTRKHFIRTEVGNQGIRSSLHRTEIGIRLDPSHSSHRSFLSRKDNNSLD